MEAKHMIAYEKYFKDKYLHLGRKEGLKEGRKEWRIEGAIACCKAGLPIEWVIQVLGLSLNESAAVLEAITKQ